MELMARYPDKHFDLAIVDPPYGIEVNMNAGRKKDTRSKKRSLKKWDCETPSSEYFAELFRVSKHQIIWGANHMIDKIKCNSQGWIFWDKCVASGVSFSDGELAWSSFNQALKKAVIPYSGFIGMEEEKFHPTTKPTKLYRWLLEHYAKPGDLLLDTHVGSASSLIAFEDMGFDYVACELDKDYYEAATKRLEQFRAQPKLSFEPKPGPPTQSKLFA